MTMSDGLHPVVINVGACRCSGTSDAHSADEVYLAPEASMTMGLRGNGAIAKADNDPALLESLLGRVLIEEGITGWTFTDEDGPVPVTPANIEKWLPWGKGGSLVAEKANDLYGEAIIAPLAQRSLQSRQPGPTNGSISPNRQSRRTRRSSSKSSSPVHSETTS